MKRTLSRIATPVLLVLLVPICADQSAGLDSMQIEAAALLQAEAMGTVCSAQSLLGDTLSMGPPSGCKGRFCNPEDALACETFCSSGGCGISLATCQDGECHCFCSGCL